MKTLAVFFCYERAQVTNTCFGRLCEDLARFDRLLIIDDSGTRDVYEILSKRPEFIADKVLYWRKTKSLGFSDSAKLAIAHARLHQPEYLYLIESDYFMAADGLARVRDVFEHTEQGGNCIGIVGYDHPNFYRPDVIAHTFPDCMKAQVGEDNCLRDVMYRPFRESLTGHTLELVSNTCFSCYLNWRKFNEIAAEFPELNDYLEQACSPRENPNYPPSGEYMRARVVDDGMLSHGINLVWNRWALRHGIDRERNAAWLNIKPSVATHISGGGLHAACPEMSSDAMSPSWRG